MTAENVNLLSEKFDKDIPAVCSFRFRNKLSNASDEKVEEVANTTLKKKGTALTLSVLLGWFGLNRFYLGDKKQGLITLIMFAVTAVLVGLTLGLFFGLWNAMIVPQVDSMLAEWTNAGYQVAVEFPKTTIETPNILTSASQMTFSEMFKVMTSPILNFQAKNAEGITLVQFLNPMAIVIDIIGIITAIVLLIFLFWWVSDIIRTAEDVPFVNYEMLVFAATGTKENLYKANAEILDEEESVEPTEESSEEVAEESVEEPKEETLEEPTTEAEETPAE